MLGLKPSSQFSIEIHFFCFSLLARALQASLGNGQPQAAAGNGNTLTQEEQDRMLALALAQGEEQTTTTTGRTPSSNDKSCQIS